MLLEKVYDKTISFGWSLSDFYLLITFQNRPRFLEFIRENCPYSQILLGASEITGINQILMN